MTSRRSTPPRRARSPTRPSSTASSTCSRSTNEFTSGNKQPAKTKFGHFYGSSYIAAPDASRCKGLSRTRDGVVIAEADLNLCRQVKDLWCLQMTARHADYAKFLSDYVAPDYKPQVVKDPSLS